MLSLPGVKPDFYTDQVFPPRGIIVSNDKYQDSIGWQNHLMTTLISNAFPFVKSANAGCNPRNQVKGVVKPHLFGYGISLSRIEKETMISHWHPRGRLYV